MHNSMKVRECITQWKIQSVEDVFFELAFLAVDNGDLLQAQCQSLGVFVASEFFQSGQDEVILFEQQLAQQLIRALLCVLNQEAHVVLRSLLFLRVNLLNLFEVRGQFKLVNHVVKVVQKQCNHFFVFLQDWRLVYPGLLFWNEPFQLELQN